MAAWSPITASALVLVAILRGWVWAAIPLALVVGLKAVAIAGGRPPLPDRRRPQRQRPRVRQQRRQL
ncbi:hypothetical protein E1295_16500 [Nonomuraea mesophila]|uniref:Uncharacterized protein n=1 Tax=Nonomuraea mesophila TaxID=2530382 RepID=A0A4R5FL91_9ACTN|nr:hypothetical protein E1295_16500 [Nonomuraea mesophila]